MSNNQTVGMYGGKFLPFHKGHLFAITQAAAMVDELYVVVCAIEESDRKKCMLGHMKEMPKEVRYQWVLTATKDMPNVFVKMIDDYGTDDVDYNWEMGSNAIKEVVGKPIDYVFSSESSYEPYFQKNYPQAKHIVIDEERKVMPISATQIRTEGVYKHWDILPKAVQPYFLKKVAIVGTESCGKSTLCRILAELFATKQVEEYGRTICEDLGGYENILREEHYKEIIYTHKANEYKMMKEAHKVLFIDSEAVVTQYYAEMDLDKQFDFIDGTIASQDYDLYLYLEPDVKWVDDGLRILGEEEVRKEKNQHLKDLFEQYHIPVQVISGNYKERILKAIEAVQKILEGDTFE